MQFNAQVKLKSSKERSYFNQLVDAFIRPPRQIYDASKLGPQTMMVNKLLIFREDFQVVSRDEKLRLECSLYSPVYLKDKPRPAVIYLHGNSSSRLESQPYAHMFASEGISLINFDFGGCGISEGQFVTLGWYEKVDFLAVLDHVLKHFPLVGPFGVWGRSMGAVTAIMAGIERPDLRTFVLDSPFSNLKQLCIDIGDNFHVPTIGVRFVFYMLRKRVRLMAKYDPKHIDSLRFIKQLSKKTSVMFVRASNDKMIGKSHVDYLYEAFQGEKYVVTFPGDHNSGRPLEVYSMIVKYFVKRLCLPEATKQVMPMAKEKTIQMEPASSKGSKEGGKEFQMKGKSNSRTNSLKGKQLKGFNSVDSDLNYDESDDEKPNRAEHDKYFPEIRKPGRYLEDDSENSQYSYDEELSDHDLPQFQDIRTKHN